MRNYFTAIILLLASCTVDTKSIKIKGSDTEVNLTVQLAETFHRVNPDIFISVSGGGSGLGIASLLNQTTDMANSSRSINNKEIQLFEKQSAQIDSFVFAQDAIAFVVASELPIDSISVNQLKNILSGNYPNWQKITGVNLPVNIYGRQSNSGTHGFIRKKLNISFTSSAKQMTGNAQILEAIKTDHSGIGYVGAGYIIHGNNEGIKVLTVYEQNGAAISPLDAKMIAAGRYYFQRPLFQYYKAGSYEKIRPFIDFEKSEQGQKIILTGGYYPIKKQT